MISDDGNANHEEGWKIDKLEEFEIELKFYGPVKTVRIMSSQ